MVTKKRMTGIEYTEELQSVFQSCFKLISDEEEDKENIMNDNTRHNDQNNNKDITTNKKEEKTTTTSTNTMKPSEILTAATSQLSYKQAKTILLDFFSSNNQDTIPILVLRAMRVIILLQHSNDETTTTTTIKEKFDKALLSSTTKLSFSAKPSSSQGKKIEDVDSKQQQHKERMERLRLKQEEHNYYKLTSNIHNVSRHDDEITTKSMTYAASIGLNMIIAPLSFGIFMYFFSGGLLSFFSLEGDSNNQRNYGASKTDISRVIIGVISGVLMLFIEMLLFVIRTHEFDKELSKKNRKNKSTTSNHQKPFGDYSSTSEKNYNSTKKSNNKKQAIPTTKKLL